MAELDRDDLELVAEGLAGDGILASDDFGGSGFLVSTGLPDDVAFEIQAIPTPGAASLIALAGLVSIRRRR